MNPESAWLVPLLADLRLVAFAGAFVFYAAAATFGRRSLVRLARIGLGVALAAAVGGYALGQPPSLLDAYAFGLAAGFVGLEFLFQLTVLGAGVALVAAVVAGVDHLGWLTPYALGGAGRSLAAYWGVWRDGVATLGSAAFTLGLMAALALGMRADRRAGRGGQPNDLRDAAALLARFALAAFWLALPAAALALWHDPARGPAAWLHAGALAALALHAPAWLAQAEGRGWTGRRTAPLVGLGIVAMIAFFLGDSVVAHLTLAPAGP